jgi:hypothetical protein
MAACQTGILPDIQILSAREILLEAIKRRPEPVRREVLHYLKFLERQRTPADWSGVLPAREVERETLDILAGITGGHTKSRRPDGSAGSE